MRDEVLRKPAAASFLGVSVRTLERMTARNEGPPKLRLSSGVVGYRATALRRWLDGLEAQQGSVVRAAP